MPDGKGPITLIKDLSLKRNRWKALAFAWRSAAISSIRPCVVCGTPALWHVANGDGYWCDLHRDGTDARAAEAVTRVPWFSGLRRALELERELEEIEL